jgi:hypothetical protein
MILRFSTVSRWVFLFCLLAVPLGCVRAQAAGEPDLDWKQPLPLARAWDINPALEPATDRLPSPSAALPEDQSATPVPSSFDSQTLPNAPATLVSSTYVPLTGNERWRNFWKDTLLSPLAYVGAFAGALGERMAGKPPQWDDRFSGYAKGSAVNIAQFAVQESIHQGGAALLHTDPRYLACRCSGGLRRVGHALEMSFLTFKDNGSKTFDFSQLAGAYGGAMIAETMYPARYSPLVQGVQNGHIQVGANGVLNLFKEFTPELSRLNPFRHRADMR